MTDKTLKELLIMYKHLYYHIMMKKYVYISILGSVDLLKHHKHSVNFPHHYSQIEKMIFQWPAIS